MTDIGEMLRSVFVEAHQRAMRNREKRPETVAEALDVLEEFLNDYFGEDCAEGVLGKEVTAFILIKDELAKVARP